jgi:septum formation protein
MSGCRLVLASASPRRRELLEEAGLEFEVVVSPAVEVHEEGLGVAGLCERNAAAKAVAVAAERPAAVVVGADTLVWLDGEPLGKPRDLAEARAMLRKLSGRTHVVCTGVCVIGAGRRECFHELTEVVFRDLDEATIGRYFARVDPLDKAGAYAVQEHGEMVVAEVRGDFSNVVGLPLGRVVGVLRTFGVGLGSLLGLGWFLIVLESSPCVRGPGAADENADQRITFYDCR